MPELKIPQIKPDTVDKEGKPITKITPGKRRKLSIPGINFTKLGKFLGNKKVKRALIGVGVFVLVLVIALGIPSIFVYRKAKALMASAQNLKSAVTEEQDINRIKEEIGNVRRDLKKFDIDGHGVKRNRQIAPAGS